MKKVSCDENGVKLALRSISNGGVIIFPTDTVYGIGCDPYNKDAVNRIYDLKKREKTKNLPILGYSRIDLEKIVEFDEISRIITKEFWPGQLTLILPLKDKKLKLSMGLNDKIAVRVPDNKCILSLLKGCKLIVGTSANISSTQPFTNPTECSNSIKGYDLLLDGGTIQSIGESTIIEIVNNKIKILRQGAISEEKLSGLI
tara:strand:+ start:1572 stop:2174 length:603 start_codon:yes stop_codon:yes gene_type:complete